MRPLKIAVVARERGRPLSGRAVGAWSYEVPEFQRTWLAQQDKTFWLFREGLARSYDLVLQEDYRVFGHYPGTQLPLAYWITDSTLSDDHYNARRDWVSAEHPNLILLDWDRTERWEEYGIPIRRLSHSVNDRLFRDYGLEKTVDVAFHCNKKGDSLRTELDLTLREICRQRGWTYASGALPWVEYAKAMNRAKVVVNLNRTPTTRNHRLFDAMACWTCVVTSPVPEVPGEVREAGKHYLEWQDLDGLTACLDETVGDGQWWRYADAGRSLVAQHHTWAVRAKDLRQTLREVFPWLR